MGWATRQAQCSPWLVSLERERERRGGEKEGRDRKNERRERMRREKSESGEILILP